MHRPLTPNEIAQLKAAHGDMLNRPAHELDALKGRLKAKHASFSEDERASMVDRLRSGRLPQ
ncbi:hypothetical protein [Streptomyces sp. NPDC050535]|uniref:hypothetical protein n=1 Tax=Streptomyces sp. NPDC050535 TaxID=3365626 RepID=UPI00379AB400